ncbi:MAG TPA: hypothetical protein VF972_02095 [Actinomycetota bacterium]
MDAIASAGLLAFKLSPFFWKGIAVVVCAFILFVGSIYVMLAAVFGLRMAYLVIAVAFFAWMIIFSAVWVLGSPGSTPVDQGPRGYEARWKVFAAGTGVVPSSYEATKTFPAAPWQPPSGEQTSEVDTVKSVMQNYLAAQAITQMQRTGQNVCPAKETAVVPTCFLLDPTTFAVQDIEFTSSKGADLVGAHGYYGLGGPEVSMFASFDKGDVPKYSITFLIASILGFGIHLPFLDRAERKRKQILTGGTAPPWFGPA